MLWGGGKSHEGKNRTPFRTFGNESLHPLPETKNVKPSTVQVLKRPKRGAKKAPPGDQPSIKSFFSRVPRLPLDAPGSHLAPRTILDKNLESGSPQGDSTGKRGFEGPKMTSELVILGPKSCNNDITNPINTRASRRTTTHLDHLDPGDKGGTKGLKMTSERVILGPKSCSNHNFYPTNTRSGVRTEPREDHPAPGEDHLDHQGDGATGQGGPLHTHEKGPRVLEKEKQLAAPPPCPPGGEEEEERAHPPRGQGHVQEVQEGGTPRPGQGATQKFSFPLQKGSKMVQKSRSARFLLQENPYSPGGG